MMSHEDAIIRRLPFVVQPARITASTSLPWAPMPSIHRGMPPTSPRTRRISSHQVVPVTNTPLPCVFQSRAMVLATRRSSGRSPRSSAWKSAQCGEVGDPRLVGAGRGGGGINDGAANSNAASGLSRRCAGNLEGSGSRSMQTSGLLRCQDACSDCVKLVVVPGDLDLCRHSGLRRNDVVMLRLRQLLVLHPMRPGRLVAHAALLVGLVLVVVAGEELHVRVAFEGDDVGGDAV